ncbi:tyrosine--tRNA ligase [Mycoplasma iguanae]|uniref:Tyrosine--tRNA ligase n=1 Tax=Mycoplasma iguanae TaxID=292461 RepID=A0ABY5R8S6_9MOLU|nr:tyrosine--tRNA ligase [Mycoplasma iguanae]UVD81572.1 tyrosine--tRNA ligase [Mycoplasma iguanae]
MKKILADLKVRNILKDITNEEKFLKQSNDEGVYIGFDPTAESLHLGNYIQISILKRFQKAGKKVLAVLGGATGMIGDPSFKAGERALLDYETIIRNKNAVKNQLEAQGLEVFDNFDIYKNMNILDFLREVGKNINISVMINRDSVVSRIQDGLSFTEFSYQLIQGWDFKYLYENFNIKNQFGGSDQWGNIVTGIELIRKYFGDENKAVGLTANLLTDAQGNKFGKSTGGGSLWLDKNKTTPFSMYQFLLNQNDAEVIKLLKWLTFIDIEKINQLEKEHFSLPAHKKAQKILAFEVVKDIHGQNAALEAEKITHLLFNNQINQFTLQDIENLKGAVPFFKVAKSMTLKESLIENKIAISNRELNEFLNNKTIEINGSKEFIVEKAVETFAKWENFFIVKKGKKNYFVFEVMN